MSNHKHLADLLKVCSILPALAIMPAMADEAKIGAESYPTLFEALSVAQSIPGSVVTLTGDVSNGSGKTIAEGADLTVDFGGNTYVAVEHAAGSEGTKTQMFQLLKDSDITFRNGTLSAVSSDTDKFKMMLQNYSNLTLDNMVVDGRGELVQYVVSNNNGVTKIKNSRILASDGVALDVYYWPKGGYSDVSVDVENTEIVGNIEVFVDGTGAIGDAKHELTISGGVLAAQTNGKSKINNQGTLILKDVDMDGNSGAENGSAIYNSVVLTDDKEVAGRGIVQLENVDFENNSANLHGGAIYNTGKLTIADSDFVENSALEQGGAINSAGTTSELYISNSKFENNKITGETENHQLGGAIKISGSAEISDTDFIGNSADGFAGAIYAGNQSDVTFESVLFQGNTASGVGALGLYKNGQLKNVRFIKNHSLEGDSGALFLGSLAQAQLDSVQFVKNTSASAGGAIATRVAQNANGTKNRNDGMLDIIDSTFVKNTAATDGGAIYNTFYTSVNAAGGAYVAKSSFLGNKAANGGAIYNDGTEDDNGKHAVLNLSDLTFADNVASDKGGAIFNGADAVINMSGTNTFANNTHGEYAGANDIYNLGTLNITDGTTTIGGGIAGTGDFVLENGATLNIGTALIQQGTVNLDGAIVASAMNSTSFGRFAGDVTVGDNATLDLTVGSVGTYDIFAGKTIDVSKVTVGDTYLVESGEDGIVITTKAVEDIAADTGLTTQAAGAIAGLANATDKNLQKVSLAAQQVLNSGDVAAVERETKKLNPTDKPVAQATAASVQNQVLSLTSGRMAGGVSVGRAGGDAVSKENGFWMQGLFNKSKLADEFNGYTRGFALGADLLIDNKWTIGGGLAVNDSDVRSNTADIDIDSKTVFLYGQYKPNNWFVNATATYSMSEYTENKNPFGVMSGAAYDVESYGVQAMGGYDFATGITAEAGLRYLHIAQDAYTDDLGFKVKATDTDFLSGVAGLKYAFAIENDWKVRLRPELRAAMTYDFISDDIVATVAMPGVASYKVDVERLSRMGGEFGIGLTALYRGMEVSLMYDLDLHKDYTSQTGMIKFRGQF